MAKKGVYKISGNTKPVVGEKTFYTVEEWYPETSPSDRNLAKVTWELFVKDDNGFVSTNIKKKGINHFTFGAKAHEFTYKIEGYLYKPEGNALIYKDQEGLSSYLAFYKIKDGSLNTYFALSSDENIIESAVWNRENNAVIKLRNLSDGFIKYHKIDSKKLNSHHQKSSSINSFTPKNYEILAKAEHDWNGDKIKDIVIVYDSIPAGKWEGIGKRPLIALKGVGNNQYQFWFRNDEAIPCRNCSGNADPTFEFNQKDGFLKYSDISLISSTVKNIEYIFDNSLNLSLVNINIEDSSNQPIKNRFTKEELGNIHLKSINIKNLENKLINSD